MVDLAQHRKHIAAHAYWDEEACVQHLLNTFQFSDEHSIAQTAERLISSARSHKAERDTLDAFLEEFQLTSAEGTALMCVAEALLRIPDSEKADELIHEKILQGDWSQHLAHSPSLFVNASTWGLLLTGKWLQLEDSVKDKPWKWVEGLMHRMGDGVIRQGVRQAMRLMGEQYILGKNVQDALKRGPKLYSSATRYSFDALGEGARTSAQAQYHLQQYQAIIDQLGNIAQPNSELLGNHSVSIKLSALHPRYQWRQRARLQAELLPQLIALCESAQQANIALTIDAEEAERLELCMWLFEQLALTPSLAQWNGLGFVVQAYQKRASYVIEWLQALAEQRDASLCVRLVKGAYWDREIKYAQAHGLPDYTVFTRKANTDLHYLYCAQKLLRAPLLYPQFASHNAATVAAVCLWGRDKEFELQRLHGMGHLLYSQLEAVLQKQIPIRVYAPIGGHRDLLPYLVRRLLENGANSSFVNRFMDEQVPAQQLSQSPLKLLSPKGQYRNAKIPKPRHIYSNWKNSIGFDLQNPLSLDRVEKVFQQARVVIEEPKADFNTIIDNAQQAFPSWAAQKCGVRATLLENIAHQFQQQELQLIQCICEEAGRTLDDAHAEVRETIEFCYYYASECRRLFGPAKELPGITGESNYGSYYGRGTIVAISPWNFPLALFCGPVLAALAAGNAVVAKPAEQTPQCALLATQLMKAAGIPEHLLQVICGDGELAEQLLGEIPLDGVVFTGSTHTAKIIQRQLAKKEGPIVPLIAETGGINTFWVDSSALLEQAVDDIIQSAFLSAGQRCSCARVLFLQEEIADEALKLLTGACDELTIGDPRKGTTDIGPIIDKEAFNHLNQAIEQTQRHHSLIYQFQKPIPEQGYFIGPHIFLVNDFNSVKEEIFGPILHVVTFNRKSIQQHIEQVRRSGYALTTGIHSRIESWANALQEQLQVGNAYINRNCTGAVVGSQPFGGHGLSGTGPKAGGQNYLLRFAKERTVTVNTVASGGNAGLFNLDDD